MHNSSGSQSSSVPKSVTVCLAPCLFIINASTFHSRPGLPKLNQPLKGKPEGVALGVGVGVMLGKPGKPPVGLPPGGKEGVPVGFGHPGKPPVGFGHGHGHGHPGKTPDGLGRL